ncbi:hypothetical protein [Pseudoalteromonas sp. T1lg23B]|uniref:hypothetical protein n=1 Tax=Pseudoalteromonas sp. T1lg23B TaxID=2077097 RepID=UPI000CF6BC85|nr:hypothetical protein [Pseudoalteromonas sp. T1lg23B]
MENIFLSLGWVLLFVAIAIAIAIAAAVLFKWDRESKDKKEFDYGIMLVLLLLCSFGSITCFYFYRFDFSLKEPLESWVEAATYFNNAFNPILLIATIVLLYRTWKTSKSELENTRSLVSTQVLLEQSNRLKTSCEKLQSVIKAPLNTYGVLNAAVLSVFENAVDESERNDVSTLIINSGYRQKGVEEILSEPDLALFKSVLEVSNCNSAHTHYLQNPEYKAFLKYECGELEYLKTFEDLVSVFIHSKVSTKRVNSFQESVLQRLFSSLREDFESPFMLRAYETLYYFNLIADELVMLFKLIKNGPQRELIESSYIRTVKLSFNEIQLDNLCYLSNRDDVLELLKIDRQRDFKLFTEDEQKS